MSESKEDGFKAMEQFRKIYGDKYPKAMECLEKDQEELFAFYDFPAKHWKHIRSTNVIESTFATVRHRHRQTKGNGSRRATVAMAFKLAEAAQKKWRKLDGPKLLEKVIEGVKFKDGKETTNKKALVA
jgi:transposase-like protein